MREPNFDNLLKVLRCEVPARPTLFEFFLNEALYERLIGSPTPKEADFLTGVRRLIQAFTSAGYDYTTAWGQNFSFPSGEYDSKASRSMNAGSLIHDRASFEAYPWPNADNVDFSHLTAVAKDLPDGMKFIVAGPGGVLENTIALVGYEDLCLLMLDDPEFTQEIFDAVGSRLLRTYELAVPYDAVGAIISNDDWGFKTQTMLRPDDMRKYVFPWHKKIVSVAHTAGKPAILHSCGFFGEVADDVIDDMQFDGKHSYEDAILPVEEVYEQLQGRIAILGGLDLDFICRATPEEVYQRAKAMLERSATRGGYALGTGNSVPYYVPQENYFAMTRAAIEG